MVILLVLLVGVIRYVYMILVVSYMYCLSLCLCLIVMVYVCFVFLVFFVCNVLLFCVIFFFFFFSHKTAYDMRISDWSSDFCSSDLECEARLADFCAKVDIPPSAAACVSELKQRLTDTAARIDAAFPDLKGDVAVVDVGWPVLRRVQARDIPASAIALQSALGRELPTHNLLDILSNIEHWTHFTRHSGPISGHEPKIKQATERYLQTIFSMGCNLGPNQAARHFVGEVSPHMIDRKRVV